MISKAVKALPRKMLLDLEKKEPTRLRRTVQVVVNAFKMHVYYPIDSFFSRTYERASRSLAFARHGWMHYDFESAYLYDIMAFKLKRIYACLDSGHAVQEEPDMLALKEAIAICERLFECKYDEKYYEAHEKKWGELQTSHDRVASYDADGEPASYYFDSSRPNAKTEAQKRQETADLKKIWKNEEKDRRADIDRLAEILKKHEPTWWD